MSRPKITITGELRFSADGLLYPILIGKPPRVFPLWEEALNVESWPGLGKAPAYPPRHTEKAEKDRYDRARIAYYTTLHSDPTYKRAAVEFVKRQRQEPQQLNSSLDNAECWAYRDKALRLESHQPQILRDRENDILLIKHFVLRREREYQRVKREVQALENMEKLENIAREPISGSVRLFVWQRDKGQCVKCGSRERLEFDHVIPIAAGGGSTERNVQLLCEACNRSKGASI